MNSGTGTGTPGATKDGGIQYCDTHKNKKVKFFCKSDQEMFCSKCVLKHTNAKHEVMPVSYKSKYIYSSLLFLLRWRPMTADLQNNYYTLFWEAVPFIIWCLA